MKDEKSHLESKTTGTDHDPRLIEHEVKVGKKPATVRRYIATIGRAHVGAGLLNPCSGEAVRLALKKMGRETSARQTQARALG